MTAESFFLDVAKISITVAGFAGVIGALRHTRDLAWKPNEVNGLKLMLDHSVVGVVVGLLPSVLSLCFADEQTVWVSLSALLAFFFAYEILINIARVRQSSTAGAPPRQFGLLLAVFFVPTVGLLYFQIHNILVSRTVVAASAGALWLVVAGCIQFVVSSLSVERS